MSEHFPFLKIHGNKYVKFSILLRPAQILTSTRVTRGEVPLLNPTIPELFGLEGTCQLLSFPATGAPCTTSLFSFQSL